MSTDSECTTCGVGFILPSGKCDHCNVEFKQVPEALLGRPMICVESLPEMGDLVLTKFIHEDAEAMKAWTIKRIAENN